VSLAAFSPCSAPEHSERRARHFADLTHHAGVSWSWIFACCQCDTSLSLADDCCSAAAGDTSRHAANSFPSHTFAIAASLARGGAHQCQPISAAFSVADGTRASESAAFPNSAIYSFKEAQQHVTFAAASWLLCRPRGAVPHRLWQKFLNVTVEQATICCWLARKCLFNVTGRESRRHLQLSSARSGNASEICRKQQ